MKELGITFFEYYSSIETIFLNRALRKFHLSWNLLRKEFIEDNQD